MKASSPGSEPAQVSSKELRDDKWKKKWKTYEIASIQQGIESKYMAN